MPAFSVLVLSVWSSFLDQADNFLIPCPFKYLTGFDCPGCGFQRAVLALAHGNIRESIGLYPAAIPILSAFLLVLIMRLRNRRLNPDLIKTLYLFTGSVILISYMFKLFPGHVH